MKANEIMWRSDRLPMFFHFKIDDVPTDTRKPCDYKADCGSVGTPRVTERIQTLMIWKRI